MLTSKLHLFYAKVNQATALHGMSPTRVADAVLAEVFPETVEAALREGADTMLRQGVISSISAYFKRAPSVDGSQFTLNIDPDYEPIVSKLKSEAHYVPSVGTLIPVALLLANSDWLDEARKYKRKKGQETIAEADALDELYHALMEKNAAFKASDAPSEREMEPAS